MALCVRGRICIITGATSGIGRATAEALARLGAAVFIVGRSDERVSRTVNEIRSATNNPNVDGVVADLRLMSEARRVAREFQNRYPAVHVLINNAGALFDEREMTAEGIESTLALNHIAYFVLTNTLMDLLKSSAPARVVNLSSEMHRMGRTDRKNGRPYNRWRTYADSKLANVLFTYELARRLEGTGVTANALHPGFVATSFAKSSRRLMDRILRATMPLIAVSPQKVAETIVYLATSPDLESTTGKYFIRKRAVSSSRQSYDVDSARDLWRESETLIS